MNNTSITNSPDKDVLFKKGLNFYRNLDEENTLGISDEKLLQDKINWEKKETFTFKFKVSVFDVAAYIIKKRGAMTTMKLHKLLYYAQAWSLVWDEQPLFPEAIEAWSNGPVIKDLFFYHRGLYTIDNVSIGNGSLLNETQKETVDSVLKFYGDKTSQWLIELTHLENPWKIARSGLSPTERGNNLISLESMAEYYSSL